MNAGNWARVERLFSQAASLSSEERAHFLAHTGESPEIASQIQLLLRHHDEADRVLSVPAWPAPASPSQIFFPGQLVAGRLPYNKAEWEKLSILLNLLTPKLPAPQEEDLSKGILEAIDMDSYRVEKKAALKIALADEEAEIEPMPTEAGGHKAEPELDRLSNILKTFNDQFGTLFTDTDRVAQRIREDIAPKVAADTAYQNAKENTPHTARMAHDQALGKVMQLLLRDDTQVYKQFVENESFKRFVGDMVYAITNP